jgi:hypothetical protein
MLRLIIENTAGATSRLRILTRKFPGLDVGMKALVEQKERKQQSAEGYFICS